MIGNRIILNGLMAVALLATSGCWSPNGSQPGGAGSAGGSVRSSDTPIDICGVSASSSANQRGSGQDAQLATTSKGNPVFPSILEQ